jgi:hypothetical protein
MQRKCFYSFHYVNDVTRVAKLRNIGMIEGNQPAKDNDWESVTKGGNAAIEKWIAEQMKGKSCTIVMVGSETADRKWINHEIVKSWEKGMGIVGIYIHGISDIKGDTSTKGANPFEYVSFADKTKLSSVVKCYTPVGANSKERYAWISTNLAAAVEEAIAIRNKY